MNAKKAINLSLSIKNNNYVFQYYQSHPISSCSVKLKILVCFNEVIMTPDLKAKNTTLAIIAIVVLLHFIFYVKKYDGLSTPSGQTYIAATSTGAGGEVHPSALTSICLPPTWPGFGSQT